VDHTEHATREPIDGAHGARGAAVREHALGQPDAVSTPRGREVRAGGQGGADQTRVDESSAEVRTSGPTNLLDGGDDDNRTAHAGLFFLLPLLARLGMPAFLGAHRELVELDFPTCLLRHVAARLAVPPDDPAIAALLPADDAALKWNGDFVAPDAWFASVAADRGAWLERPAVLSGGDDRRALTDGSWRLVLALRRTSGQTHSLAAGVPLAAGGSLRATTAMEVLLASWLTAMRRWCHRHTGMGLRRLVTRNGRVSATRTHLDVYFDLRQIDVGVRRAGLDIDPGWLPWFGRVVAYHYASGGFGRAR
jgi:hypothetical protein